jgi:hypothetical protein
MAELHGEASSGDADRRRFNKPMPPPPSFFLVDSVLHLCAPPGRPWWRGGAAWRCSGFVAARSRPAMVARKSGSAQPVLLLAGELALSSSAAASSSLLLPWRLGGDGFAPGMAVACVELRASESFSPASYGGCVCCHVRTQGCRAPLLLLRPLFSAAAMVAVALGGVLVGSGVEAPGPDSVSSAVLGSFLHFCRASL